jgi:predicted nucleotidyltransferase
MNKKTIILQVLKNQITNYFGNDLVNIYLFGSQAKNTETVDSDYDILVLLKTKIDWKTKD